MVCTLKNRVVYFRAMQTNSYQNFQKQLGARIKSIRKYHRFSQEQVGLMVGVSRVSIGYIEQGKRSPRLSTLYALAEVFEVDIVDFFAFEEPATPRR